MDLLPLVMEALIGNSLNIRPYGLDNDVPRVLDSNNYASNKLKLLPGFAKVDDVDSVIARLSSLGPTADEGFNAPFGGIKMDRRSGVMEKVTRNGKRGNILGGLESQTATLGASSLYRFNPCVIELEGHGGHDSLRREVETVYGPFVVKLSLELDILRREVKSKYLCCFEANILHYEVEIDSKTGKLFVDSQSPLHCEVELVLSRVQYPSL
ncbi:hypothetical protein F3Y22_tig00111708pilonHSYRG00293 [Hibiscus syriacus]|uniref:Uncharacterized protein n=1 Tax=Hibiscus syriacus TaxID=106335 RepID=A0A6A2YB65_HIBSY|nr:hypothetical protein F3Y22_tig00111708pilonHSYRG00293 [Hibiscus syriacus]